MLYLFIAGLIISGIIAVVRSLYASIYVLVFTGTVLWLYALFGMGARWQYQLLGISMMAIGVILAHLWEELFRKKE